MAKATYINNHDWLAVRATFRDGSKANVTWSRNAGPDGNVMISPNDSRQAEVLSLIVAQAAKNTEDENGFRNLRDVCETMKAVAEKAETIDAYLDGLKAALGVTGERPRPKGADNAPAATTTSRIKTHGGWQIKAMFPTGERIDLKINRSSVGLAMDPQISSKFNEVMNFVFAMKNLAIHSEEDFASLIEDAAKEAGSMDEWIDGMRSKMAPAPRA